MWVSFDPDHEDMVAEIYVGGRCLALVSQDEGREWPSIELYPAPGDDASSLPLAEVEAAIARVTRKLGELRPIAAREVRKGGLDGMRGG